MPICRVGGSIPAAAYMKTYLGITMTMFGFGLPGNNIHAPNERCAGAILVICWKLQRLPSFPLCKIWIQKHTLLYISSDDINWSCCIAFALLLNTKCALRFKTRFLLSIASSPWERNSSLKGDAQQIVACLLQIRAGRIFEGARGLR